MGKRALPAGPAREAPGNGRVPPLVGLATHPGALSQRLLPLASGRPAAFSVRSSRAELAPLL
jgi:hypothetical protein